MVTATRKAGFPRATIGAYFLVQGALLLPISLTLRNFLSYRDSAPTLRLEDIHVACLCGPNGHGKSALLDAITWALWGRARGQRQEQLLHHGQDEMSVELEFDVGGDRYRVARRYSRARRSAQSSLELGAASGEGYRPITGDSIRETEARIVRLINMDYDTFVNSAFLVQGRADLFAMATPAQRKEVLSRVLGLGLYDRLEARAKEHGREAQARLQASEMVLDRLRAQVARRDEVGQALTEANAGLSEAARSVESLQERLELVRRQVSQLERRRAEQGEMEGQASRARTRKDEAEREAARLEERLRIWRGAIEQAKETEEGFAALAEARKRLESLNSAAQAVHALERELFPLEQTITAARAALERDVHAQERHVEQELRPRAEAQPAIEERLSKLTGELAEVQSRTAEAQELTERQQALALEAKRLEQENARLTEQGKEINSKLSLLDHEHADGAECPLCGTGLGPEARERMRSTYQTEIAQLRTVFREQAAKAQQLAAQAEGTGKQAAEVQQRIEAERRRLEGEQSRLVVQKEDAERAKAQMEQALRLLAEARDALEKQSYAQTEQAQAKDIRTRIEGLGFDAAALADAERRARELGRWEEAHTRLAEAKQRLPEDEASLEAARRRAQEASEELASMEARRAEIQRELADLPGFQTQEQAIAQELAAGTQRRDALQSRRGSLAHQMEEIQAAEAELHEREGQRRAAVEEAAAYSELALAFGKGGVQALLIEAAIPRLEDEANDLLRRMTDGRMSLKLETQRARRTGRAAEAAEAIETLEIVIADEIGTRAYEMFSGGERFRVDFALRIALSKLLAWRAGAPLPTLFIDEGFGTQDIQGRDRILDVIKAIEDRFQRILVITHMDEIKEAFPVRVEVTRSPGEGSTFSIS